MVFNFVLDLVLIETGCSRGVGSGAECVSEVSPTWTPDSSVTQFFDCASTFKEDCDGVCVV